MCYGYNIGQVQKMIKEQLPEAGGDLHGFDRPKAPIITMEFRKVEYYNWWLLPSWFEKEDYSFNLLNARQETIFEKPSFRNLILSKRCLVPATHYYEYQWRDAKGKVKNKHRIGVKGGHGFFMAGIYDSWNDPATNEAIKSFSIITTEANELCAEIHNSKKRMPVILEEEKARKWLNPQASPEEVKNLLTQFDSSKMWAENLDASHDLFG